MVEYTPGYSADHWCIKGHILLCMSGTLTELEDGRRFTLTPGMSYQLLTTPNRTFAIDSGATPSSTVPTSGNESRMIISGKCHCHIVHADWPTSRPDSARACGCSFCIATASRPPIRKPVSPSSARRGAGSPYVRHADSHVPCLRQMRRGAVRHQRDRQPSLRRGQRQRV